MLYLKDAPRGRPVPCCTVSIEPDGKERVGTVGADGVDLFVAVVRTESFGRLWAPQSLSEFAALVEFEGLGPTGLRGWRGQADVRWPLHSSALRRLLAGPRGWLLDDASVREGAVRSYEQRLLQTARLAGHGHFDRPLTDLELLAKLQHHGGATRLLDFTRNAFVGLWFACRHLADRWGVVFGVNLDEGRELHTQESVNASLVEVLDSANGRLSYWHPSPLSPRMPAQAGFLLWSDVRELPWGSVGSAGVVDETAGTTVSKLTSEFAAIAIPPDLKADMQDRWESLLGLSEEALFPDFDGFAVANGAMQPLTYRFLEHV